VGRGYLGDPQRTAEAFLADADREVFGAPGRLYKTGDLARYQPDGTIEFLGRIDHQVKLRGYRIELGEVETVLSQHEAVRQAVVVARQDAPGDKRLVAYVVLHEGGGGDSATAELKQHLLQALPAYMLPGAFVVLEALPLTPNGKLDRAALPAPDAEKLERRETYVAPRNDLEEVVAGTWEEVLGVEQVGIHDSFFELGGHSLLIMQVISRLRSALQVELLPGHFAGDHTVAQFAASIEHLKAVGAQQAIPLVRRRTRPTGSTPSSSTPPKGGSERYC
jgi:hypothetical protein